MYKKAKYLTTISGEDKKTAYFLCQNPKILIPMELHDCDRVNYPDLGSVCTNVLKTLNISIVMSRIFQCRDDQLYACLVLRNEYRTLEINISPAAAIKISHWFNTPLYIDEHMVRELGLRVTKEMIDRALKDNCSDH